MSDRLAEIECNWDPEARHDCGFLTMNQVAWLIAEVKRQRAELANLYEVYWELEER